MTIYILGGGWFGCHLATAFLDDGFQVKILEKGSELFKGASGSNPARLHIGTHYPRSALTRHASQAHFHKFMQHYGELTRAVPINLYAIAANESMVDFQTYRKILLNEIEYITVHDPAEFGLANVEGALLVPERHIVIDEVREFFQKRLEDYVLFNTETPEQAGIVIKSSDWVIDCTFCANDEKGIDRFEPCVMTLLEGPVNKAVTIMDGPFPSLYPWNEKLGLNSLTSASLTPIVKDCATYDGAKEILNWQTKDSLLERGKLMVTQISKFYPAIRDEYKIADFRLGIRAMPMSGSDARLVDVVVLGKHRLRIRAGKIDSIFKAYDLVTKHME